jgi:hypothetical protein
MQLFQQRLSSRSPGGIFDLGQRTSYGPHVPTLNSSDLLVELIATDDELLSRKGDL